MPVFQANGTATTSPSQVTWGGDVSTTVFVQNADSGAGSIQVSFDGGSVYKTLPHQWDFISIDVNITEFFIRSSTGSKAYEVVIAI